MEQYETLKSKLQKIAKLAESGILGERTAAKKLLGELCKKYNMTEAELFEPAMVLGTFRVRTKVDKKILIQCTSFIIGKTSIDYFQTKSRKGVVFIEATAAEIADLHACFRHYQKEYAREVEKFFVAFINKHGIFPEQGKKIGRSSIDPEELLRLQQMIAGIGGESWQSVEQLKGPYRLEGAA